MLEVGKTAISDDDADSEIDIIVSAGADGGDGYNDCDDGGDRDACGGGRDDDDDDDDDDVFALMVRAMIQMMTDSLDKVQSRS